MRCRQARGRTVRRRLTRHFYAKISLCGGFAFLRANHVRTPWSLCIPEFTKTLRRTASVGSESQVIFPRAAQEMKSFPNIQMLLIGAVTLALGAAAVPVALGILELGHLRGSIAKIEQAVSEVKLARDVIDKASQSLVNFTAVALELSPADRSKVLADAERQFNELDPAVERVTKSSSNALFSMSSRGSARRSPRLPIAGRSCAIRRPTRSLRSRRAFTSCVSWSRPGSAKHLLLTFEAEASQAAQNEAATSFERLGRSTSASGVDDAGR